MHKIWIRAEYKLTSFDGDPVGTSVGLEEGDTDGAFNGDPVGLSVSGLDPQDPNEVDVELPNSPDDMAVVVMAELPSTVTSTDPSP